MSSKTRTRKTRTTGTADSDPILRPVPDHTTAAGTAAEDKLWEVLHARPNSTAADLSAAAKIGKSTAQKILVKWAGDGSVTRTPGIAEGGRRRAADLWVIAESDPSDASDTADDGTVTATDGAPADERTVEDTAPADTTQDKPTTTPGDPDPADIADDAPAEENRAESVDAKSTAAPASDEAQDTTDATDDAAPEKAEPADAEPADAEPASTEATNPAQDATPDNATQSASDGGKGGKAERLAPGALRGMVEDHLRDHPEEKFGPTAIAKALGGKSSGAVSNALDKLVEDGVAVKTQDKPRRFGLAPVEPAAAGAPTH